ncbi:MAG: ATP-binding protein [Balneolaceae bacterium]
MLNHSITYQLTVKASTENLSEVRDFVATYARQEGFSSQQITDTRLAVDEAFTNIIKHAYQNDESKPVNLELQFDSEKLCIIISDQGKAFDVSKYTFPDVKTQIKNKQRGGMGVYLIHNLMDEVTYRNQKEKNLIIMCKHR